MLKLRVAKPTNHLAEVASMYCEGLDFSVLSRFEGHDGFDGIIVGIPNSPYHFEFTSEKNHKKIKENDPDDLIVLYESSPESYKERVEKMKIAGFECVTSFNPYWDDNGATFEDIEKRRVVIVNGDWNK